LSPSKLSLVLPVYNQEDHIRGVVESYTTVLDRIGGAYELMLVTNGCRDNSVAICQELAETYPGVETIDIGLQGGWGRAVRAGLQAVTGDTIGYTNSARTSPEILALCASYSRAFPDVVVKANRKIRDNWRRRAGSLVYNLEVRALFDLPVWDINGTPKIFPRSFGRLLDLEREDDLIDAEFNVICRREGYPIVEVPVLSTQRHGGTSTTNYGSAVRMYQGALELRRRYGKMP
jgi:glycosyltransferase involved in cell wall biosynthesis